MLTFIFITQGITHLNWSSLESTGACAAGGGGTGAAVIGGAMGAIIIWRPGANAFASLTILTSRSSWVLAQVLQKKCAQPWPHALPSKPCCLRSVWLVVHP